MATEAKVIIKGQNNIGPAVKSAASDLSAMKEAADRLGSVLKTALSVTAIIGSVKALGTAAKACFSDFSEAERSYRKLALAIGNQSGYDQVVSSIENLSRKTLSSKSDIEAMAAELAQLGKSADEITRISEAAVYLSNVTGRDLNSSMTTLLGTYNGTTTQLRKLGIDLGNVTKEELAQGAAIDRVIDSLGEYSSLVAEQDTSQHLRNISNTWGDIKQAIGGIIDFNFGPWVASLDSWFQSMYGNITSVVSYLGAVIAEFPSAMTLAGKAVSAILRRCFSWETISSGVQTLVKNAMTILKNLATGIIGIGPGLLSSLASMVGNWMAHIFSSMDDRLIGTFNYIKAVAQSLPELFSVSIEAISTMFKSVFTWESLKLSIETTFTNIGLLFKALFDGILKSIPEMLADILAGIGWWLKSLGASLKIAILGGIQEAVNEAGTTIKDKAPWLGKLFGLGDKLEAVDFGLDRTEPETYRQRSHDSFASIGLDFSSGIQRVADSLNEAADNTRELGDSLFGDVIQNTKESFGAIIGPKLDEINSAISTPEDYLSASSEAVKGIRNSFSDIAENIVGTYSEMASNTMSFLDDNFGDITSDFRVGLNEIVAPRLEAVESKMEASKQTSSGVASYGGSSDDEKGTIELLKDSFSSKLSAFGEKGMSGIISPLSDSFGSLVSSVEPVIRVFTSANPLLSAAIPVFQGFVSVVGPALKTLIAPIMDALSGIGVMLGNIMLPILDALYPAFTIIGNVITAAVTPALRMLSPIIGLLSGTFKAMNPVIVLLAKAFTVLMSPVQFVADLFSWLGKWITYLGDCVSVCAWNLTHWFNKKSYGSSPGSFSSDAFTGLGNRLSQWDDLGSQSRAIFDSVSTGTAVSSASYQGATQVTINIYQESPVVGDGGMRQFAQMIREEFLGLDYYGVTV